MSHISNAHLVRVLDHDELRMGMTVVDFDCDDHPGRNCAQMLLARYVDPSPTHMDGSPCAHRVAWETSHVVDFTYCFCGSIETGCLYRLRDLDEADEEGRRIGCDIDDRRRALAEEWATRKERTR